MVLYAGGNWLDPAAPHYQLASNFLSDLGMTHAYSGRANYASCVLFGIALATLGAAIAAFAWTWPHFAGARWRAVGHASAIAGTASGLAFVGVAVTPFDLAIHPHLMFVFAAFALLTLYVAATTLVMWRNDVSRARIAANLGYLVMVIGYIVLAIVERRVETETEHAMQVIGQKVIAYGSMVHAVYVATTARRARFAMLSSR